MIKPQTPLGPRTSCPRALLFSALLLSATGRAAHGGLIDPNLDVVLRQAAPGATVSTLVHLVDRVDPETHRGHEEVVRALREMAAWAQSDLLAELEAQRADGAVRDMQRFWIANAIRVDAAPAAIRMIADRRDVDMVYLNYPIERIAPERCTGPRAQARGGPESGVEAVRAPEVWALGITGTGALMAALDTGVDGAHEALASRWRGAADPRYEGHPEWAWFDPVTATDFPEAFGGHGTHTTGTMCGGAPGDPVGVAPGAQWIHAATIARGAIPEMVSDSLLAFEWLIDPDGDPATNFDVPAVCSNAWGLSEMHGYPPCDETFWSHLDACEAAGIVILFSAGGAGPTGGLTRPADRATDLYRTLAVGAVDGGDPGFPIAGFSSRGPTECTPGGEKATKPDMAAPGVNVRSAWPVDDYRFLSGTSMAVPHVAGTVALVREANQVLSGREIKQIIYDTSLDLGKEGKDNAYGWGMVDAFEAVLAALDRRPPGDVDGDGDADFDDLLRILGKWGPCPACPEDLDGSGAVGFDDLLLVLSNWTP